MINKDEHQSKIIEEIKKRNPRYVITGMTQDRQLVINDKVDSIKLYISADEFEKEMLRIN